MKLKTIFALVLALMFVFCSCTQTTNTETDVPSTDTPVEESTTDETDEPEYEFATLTIGVPTHATITTFDSGRNLFTKYLEDTLNLKLEFVYFPTNANDYLRQIALMASSPNIKFPDLLMGFYDISDNLRNSYGQEGYFVDISQYMEYLPNMTAAIENAPEDVQSRIKFRMYDTNGAAYGAPTFFSVSAVDDLANMMWINKEWLDNLGLEVPTTVEELHDVLVAFRDNDCNGNGIDDDEYPLYGSSITICDFIVNAYVHMDGAYPFNVEDGQLTHFAQTDAYREALKVLNQWYKEKLIAPYTFTTANNNEAKQIITPNSNIAKVGVWNGHPALAATQTNPILSEYVALAPLEAETETGGYIALREKRLWFKSIITTDCKNIEAACRLIDAFFTDTVATCQRHGIEGLDWERGEGENMYGDTDAYVKVLNSNAFFKGGETWGREVAGCLTSQNYFALTNVENEYDVTMNRLLGEQLDIIEVARYPEESCMELSYSNEDYETRGVYEAAVGPWMRKYNTYFITGEKDPNSDEDWKEFQDGLTTNKIEEYTELMQKVYEENKR